jgi:uncharacterized protein (TIGR02246 family)
VSLSAQDITALRAAEQSLCESFENADATAWVEFYTDDAIMITAQGHEVQGREALLAVARQLTLSSFKIAAQTTDGDGDIAAVLGRGSWVSGVKGSGGPTTRVRFLIVWRRDADRPWRIARELLSTDAPLSG